jgi:hypothetical protein
MLPERWTLARYNERLDAPHGGTSGNTPRRVFGIWFTRKGRTGPGPVGPRGWRSQSYNERLEALERERK